MVRTSPTPQGLTPRSTRGALFLDSEMVERTWAADNMVSSSFSGWASTTSTSRRVKRQVPLRQSQASGHLLTENNAMGNLGPKDKCPRPSGIRQFGSPDKYLCILPGDGLRNVPIPNIPPNSTRCLPNPPSPDAHRTPTQPARRRRNNSTLFLLPGASTYRQNVLARELWEIWDMRPRLPLGLASWYETGGSPT